MEKKKASFYTKKEEYEEGNIVAHSGNKGRQ